MQDEGELLGHSECVQHTQWHPRPPPVFNNAVLMHITHGKSHACCVCCTAATRWAEIEQNIL